MKILVPTDGSKNALRAVKYAAKLAGELKSESTITLISVHDDTALRHAERFVGKKAVDEYLRDQAGATVSHGICPKCRDALYPRQYAP